MDIRELRIGDWIETHGYSKVSSIGDDNFVYVRHYGPRFKLLAVDCNPIPLTDELLEKIGAKEINIEGFHYLYIGNKEQSVLLHHSRYAYVFTTECYVISVRKPIKYLHQLQHELYDAGIEIKIEL